MEIIILFTFFFAFWAFVRWDQRRLRDAPVEPLDRQKLTKGFTPGASVLWQGYAGVSVISFVTGVSQVFNPPTPPFTGRWSWLYSILFSSFGSYGPGAFMILAGLAFLVASLVAYDKSRK